AAVTRHRPSANRTSGTRPAVTAASLTGSSPLSGRPGDQAGTRLTGLVGLAVCMTKVRLGGFSPLRGPRAPPRHPPAPWSAARRRGTAGRDGPAPAALLRAEGTSRAG